MPASILIHPGFHKTGTTTVQKGLRANNRTLRRDLRIVLRPGMVALCEAARGYSLDTTPLNLGLVTFEAAELAQSWAADGRAVLLSSEDLCGHMPGRQGLKSYAAATALLRAITDSIAAVHPGVAIRVHFTTRAPAAWLRSCYVLHLRATRITRTAMQYARSHRRSADLTAIVAAVSETLPECAVSHSRLEDCAHNRLGPLGAVLDAAGIGPDIQDRLRPVAPANVAPPQARLDHLLSLNRSDLSDDALRLAKSARGTAHT